MVFVSAAMLVQQSVITHLNTPVNLRHLIACNRAVFPSFPFEFQQLFPIDYGE